MCVSGITIKNPCYISPDDYNKLSVRNQMLRNLRHRLNTHIQVGCGTCSECSRRVQNAVAQRCNIMLRDYYAFYGTLTYNNEHLPNFSASDGDVYYYADTHHFTAMLKRLRTSGDIPCGCRYLLVTEYGSEKFRPHLHFLLFIPKTTVRSLCNMPEYVQDYTSEFMEYIYGYEQQLYWVFRENWKIKVNKSRKYPKYEMLFTYREKYVNGKKNANYDFHFVKMIEDHPFEDVFIYVSKYCVHYDERVWKMIGKAFYKYDYDEYKEIRRLCRPKIQMSTGFGVPLFDDLYSIFGEEVERYVSSSDKTDYLKYYDPETKKVMRLCRYYEFKLMDTDMMLESHRNKYGSNMIPCDYNDEVPITEYNDDRPQRKWRSDHIHKRMFMRSFDEPCLSIEFTNDV